MTSAGARVASFFFGIECRIGGVSTTAALLRYPGPS
jgi:hypothetical protein